MLPIEAVHYAAWAERLGAGLEAAYPRTLWLVLDQTAINRLAPEEQVPRQFRVVAMTQDGSRQVFQEFPFTLVVDEEAFALVVVALGREVERRLAAMVGEDGGGTGGV